MVLTLTPVWSRGHWTYSLTGRVVTVLAHNRLKGYLRIICRLLHFGKFWQWTAQPRDVVFFISICSKAFFTRIIAIDAQPVHVTTATHFAFAHYWNIVFCMACDYTSSTSWTRIEVNGQVEMMPDWTVKESHKSASGESLEFPCDL